MTHRLSKLGAQIVMFSDCVDATELPPPATRLIHLRGPVSPMDLASVVKTVKTLSKLAAEVSITLPLESTLEGELANRHAVQMVLKNIQEWVAGMILEDVMKE